MAAKRTKPEGVKPWQSKTLSEVKVSDTQIWRAQQSISPDGDRFLGLRKFIVKKDGSEQITSTGFNVPYDAKAKVTLKAIESLLDDLIQIAVKAK